MAAAHSAIGAAAYPQPWLRTPDDPDQTLVSFQQYMRYFERYVNIANLVNLSVSQKWDLIICVGGSQMEDLVVYEAGITTRPIPQNGDAQAVEATPS